MSQIMSAKVKCDACGKEQEVEAFKGLFGFGYKTPKYPPEWRKFDVANMNICQDCSADFDNMLNDWIKLRAKGEYYSKKTLPKP